MSTLIVDPWDLPQNLALSGYWGWGCSIGQSQLGRSSDIYLFSVAIPWRVTGSQPDCRLFGV